MQAWSGVGVASSEAVLGTGRSFCAFLGKLGCGGAAWPRWCAELCSCGARRAWHWGAVAAVAWRDGTQEAAGVN